MMIRLIRWTLFVLWLLESAAFAQPDFGMFPGAVVVQSGESLDVCEPRTETILAVHGRLKVCSELRVQTLFVYADGELLLEPGCHIIVRDLPIDADLDTEQWGNGLLILGKIRTQTTPKTLHCRVENVNQGATSITVQGEAPSDWAAGDELILPRSRENNPAKQFGVMTREEAKWPRFYAESERVTIASISDDTIMLTSPTKWEHHGAVDRNDQQVTWVPVANVTRGIVIESENPDGVRGHVAIMQRADCLLDGVTFRHLGRTTIHDLNSALRDSQGNYQPQSPSKPPNQIGRYPLHLHHLIGPIGGVDGGQYQGIVRNCVVDNGDTLRPEKWGIALHRASWCLVEGSAVYNVAGGAIVEEDGIERNNSYIGNYLCNQHSRTHFGVGPERENPLKPGDDTDLRGTGANAFWFAHVNEAYCQDNICCDLNVGPAVNWNLDEPGSFYWVAPALHHKFMPTARGQDMSQWVSLPKNYPSKHLITIVGGEVFGGSGSAASTVSGFDPQQSRCDISNHTSWHLRMGLNDYWMELHSTDCKFYGNPNLKTGNSNALKSSRTNSVHLRTYADNFAVGAFIRPGRHGQNVVIEDFDSSCDTHFQFLPSVGAQGYLCTIRRPNLTDTAILAEVVMPKPAALNHDSFLPHAILFDEWIDGKTYRAYPRLQDGDFVIPSFKAAVAAGVAGLTNAQARQQKGLSLWGSLTTAGVQMPKTINLTFVEQ